LFAGFSLGIYHNGRQEFLPGSVVMIQLLTRVLLLTVLGTAIKNFNNVVGISATTMAYMDGIVLPPQFRNVVKPTVDYFPAGIKVRLIDVNNV
jgi:hypothetical protein